MGNRGKKQYKPRQERWNAAATSHAHANANTYPFPANPHAIPKGSNIIAGGRASAAQPSERRPRMDT